MVFRNTFQRLKTVICIKKIFTNTFGVPSVKYAPKCLLILIRQGFQSGFHKGLNFPCVQWIVQGIKDLQKHRFERYRLFLLAVL